MHTRPIRPLGSGQLERLMRSDLRYCESLAVIDAHAAEVLELVAIRRVTVGCRLQSRLDGLW
jgi:hypothetical protein